MATSTLYPIEGIERKDPRLRLDYKGPILSFHTAPADSSLAHCTKIAAWKSGVRLTEVKALRAILPGDPA